MTVGQGAARRAAALTHRLLAFSRRQTLDPKPTDVNRLVDGLLEMVQRTVGPGIHVEVVARVFEPFFTTKPIGEGTGLGLSMIYGFAQQSGGQVRVYSDVGKGTTVCLYLPRHYGEVDDEDGAAQLEALERSDQGETVLVVDDEPTVRMLVTDILEDLGYLAIEAGDSAAGLEVLQSDVRIDLLVTDVGLPGGMNGRQMADAARVKRLDLKVLFITGYAENAILGNGYLAPGMAVLTKPFPVETMAARIRSMIEAGK